MSVYYIDEDGNISIKKRTAVNGTKQNEAKWLKGGAFADGWQFGDLTKTILGTTRDVKENVTHAVLEATENLIDTTAFGVGQVAGWFGADDFRDNVGEFIAKDPLTKGEMGANVNKVLDFTTPEGLISKVIIGDNTEGNSILGDKSDGLVQSVSHLVGSKALSMVGVPSALTMGVNAFGSEIEQAYKNDATHKEAFISGSVAAGAEILIEKIFGGIKFGGKTLDEGATKTLSRNISKRIVRSILKWVGDTAGEGLEEYLTESTTNVARRLTYADEMTLKDILWSDEHLDAFVGGAIMGGAAGGYNATKAGANGVEYASELTANEEKVVRHEYEKRVAEKTKNGEKVDKAKIWDEVIEDMEKGYISTDTIEEVLGDKSYDNLKQEADEFNTLYNKEGGMSKAQQDRLAELEAKNKSKPYKALLEETKKKRTESVRSTVRFDRLGESYREAGRVYEKFQIDPDKYKGRNHEDAAKKTIQSAIDAGANNTNRVHDLVEMAASVSADTGKSFSFKSGEQIKSDFIARQQSEIAKLESLKNRTAEQDAELSEMKSLLAKVESGEVIIDGDISADGIVLNLDSNKPLNRVVGHEITHHFEPGKGKNSKHYEELRDSLFAYAKTKGRDIDAELAVKKAQYAGVTNANAEAELVADLVGDFLFTDLDYVKKLSVENRNVFQKIWDEIKYLAKVATTGSKEGRELARLEKAFADIYREGGNAKGTKYSISATASDSDGKKLTKEQQEYFKDSKMRDENGNLKVMYHGSQDAGFHVFDSSMSDDGTSFFFVDRNDVAASYSGTTEIYEAKSFDTVEDANKFFAEIGRTEYSVAEKDGEYTLYDDGGEVATSESLAEIYEEFCDYEGVGYGNANYKVYLNLTNPLEVDAGGRNWDNVSREYSQEVADKYNSLTAEEKAELHDLAGWGEISIFRDEIRNAQGGALASAYAKLGEDINMYDLFSIAEDNFSEESIQQFAVKQMNTRDYAAKAKAEGYDGVIFKNIHDNGGYSNGSEGASTVAIAFNSEQIKSTANEKPTGNKDIRYSLSEKNEIPLEQRLSGDALLDAQDLIAEIEDVSEISPNGYVTVYHRTTEANANRIMESGKMSAKEDGIFFSTQKNGAYSSDYGKGIVKLKVPVEKLVLDDVFDTEAHLRIPLKSRSEVLDVFEYMVASDTKQSLSNQGEQFAPSKNDIYGKDFRVQTDESIAPVPETENVADVAKNDTSTEELFPDDLAPIESELERLEAERMEIYSALESLMEHGTANEVGQLSAEYDSITARIRELENKISEEDSARLESIDDADIPPEMEAPYYEEQQKPTMPKNPFTDRDEMEVGNRKVKAYQYENPEVKPFFEDAARGMLYDLNNTTKGERIYNDQVYYDSGGEAGWMGTKRHTTDDIAELLDQWHYTYAEIEKGLNAIIEDNGKENNAISKRIEFMLNDRLMYGYKDVDGMPYPPDQNYINFLREKEITEYSKEAFDSFMATADLYAPPGDIAPTVAPPATAEVLSGNTKGVVEGQKTLYTRDKLLKSEDIAPTPVQSNAEAMTSKSGEVKGQQAMYEDAIQNESSRMASILTEEPNVKKKKLSTWAMVKNSVLDKGMVFEDIALKTGNRELQARWNSIRYAEGKAQKLIGEGNSFTSSLKSIQDKVEQSGKTQQFYEYLYHMHNIDRMTLEERFKDTPNKAVFGDKVTAEVSRNTVDKLVKENPEFKQWAQEVYEYNEYLRGLLVDGGVISKETAALWKKMYPHYVPIRRAGDTGLNINVPLDTGRTGVNAPIKRAKGGSRDILPLFDTIGQRTIQTYRAIAKNRFGVELKNTLGTTIENEAVGIDETIDSIDTQDGLLQEGKNGQKPTFTVFENGEKVTFEITDEMYNAMKPTSDFLGRTYKIPNAISNFRRGTLTEYNPWFLLKNAIKDVQDVLINSQHAVKTYASIPKAIKEMSTNGQWYQEYLENGGDQNTYFDNDSNTFTQENKALETIKKYTGLNAISKANNIIERIPRLAEYIASREAGRSVDVAMLDAARVTTNFAAGGDLTKWANRNGATFLNASVQGLNQQVRNIREAKANGLKGVGVLAAKFAVAGLPVLLLNNLMWDDDEEYEQLSDYVKDNYYIVGKYGDGKFVRIPKGRMVSVIQNAFGQMENLVTGDDEVDLGRFSDLLVTNLAPNNPLDNNILSPIVDVAKNETWYGEDLVPERLQDLPAGEQYDETTSSISKWLGEKTNTSPYKWNYLLDQYGGVLGDTFLPMMTPEAESGNDSFAGNMIAPLKDMFTTDSVIKNQNVSDFYDKKDELTVNANSSKATDEDVLMSKYMSSVNAQLSDLYKQKREIQNSDLSDAEKYYLVRDIQQQINSIAKDSLDSYSEVDIDGKYATVGDVQFRWYEPGEDSTGEAGWKKLTEEQIEKQDEVTKGLGITPAEYWTDKGKYDFAYEYPEKYEFLSDNGVSYEDYKNGNEEFKDAWTWASNNPEKFTLSKAVAGDVITYRKYTGDLYDIKADKDSSGKSINGSRKEKVIEYINNMDADYGEKIILFKSEYPADDTYNYDIIEYLNSREDISYEDMETILKELGFEVDKNGNISW